MARDHPLDGADDEGRRPRRLHLLARRLATATDRGGEAVEDLLVLLEGRPAGDVNLAYQRLRDLRLPAGESEEKVESGAGAGLPLALGLGGEQHLLAQGLRPLLVGRRKALGQVAEVPVELPGIDPGALEQPLTGERAVAELAAQLQDSILQPLARKRAIASLAGPRPRFSHIGLLPRRGCPIPLPDRAARSENYIPLHKNVAPTQWARYLDRMERAREEVPIVPLGRHGLAPDVVAAHQRERLFNATVELVARRGYRDTSVDNIVKSARVGYVSFYELFDGKEACFLAAFDRIVEEATEAVAEAIAEEQEWAQQITAGLACLVELAAADPERARIALIEVQAASPNAYVRYEKIVDRGVPKLREGRALNPAAEQFSETLEEATLGGIAWIVHQRLVRGELDEIEPLLEEVVQIALSPYLGDAGAREVAAATVRERLQRR